jgi:hypothetical protein
MAEFLKTEIAQIQHEITEELGSPLRDIDTQYNYVSSPFWIIQILSLFVNLINSIITFFNARIKALEEEATDSTTSETPDLVAPNTQHHLAPPLTSRRCTKCHARSHIEPDCKIADPAAMRRRVVANQRRKKDARCTHIIPAIPPPLPYHYLHNPIAFPQPQVNFAALAADASELRRRQTQSARDKRLVLATPLRTSFGLREGVGILIS